MALEARPLRDRLLVEPIEEEARTDDILEEG